MIAGTPGRMVAGRQALTVLFACALWGSAACSDPLSPSPQPDPTLESDATLSIVTTPPVLSIGETGQALAYLHVGPPESRTTTMVTGTWESSDSGIAGIRSDGVISALGAGTATFTGRYRGLSRTINLRVLAPQEAQLFYFCGAGCGVRSDGTEVWRMTVGQVTNFIPRAGYDRGPNHGTIVDIQPGNRSTWSSSNPDIVSVTDGRVTARAKGVATVTATWNGASAPVPVTVN